MTEAQELLGPRADIDGLKSAWNEAHGITQRREEQLAEQKKTQATPGVTEDTTPRSPRRQTPEQRRDLQRKYQDGLAAFTSGDFDEAIHNWRAVWFEDPHLENVSNYLIKAYLFQGVELYGRGQYEEAMDRCKRVLEIDPTNEKALRYLDRIKEEQLEIEEIERGKSGE